MNSQKIIKNLQKSFNDKNSFESIYLIKIPIQYKKSTSPDVWGEYKQEISENEKWIGPLTENMKCDYFQKFKLPTSSGNKDHVNTYKIQLISNEYEVFGENLSCYCFKYNKKVYGTFKTLKDLFNYLSSHVEYENVKIIHAIFSNKHYNALFENNGVYNIKDIPLGICVGCGYKQQKPAQEGYWICGLTERWACYDCKYGRKGQKPIPSRAFACESCTSNDVTWYQGGGYDCHRCKNLGLNKKQHLNFY